MINIVLNKRYIFKCNHKLLYCLKRISSYCCNIARKVASSYSYPLILTIKTAVYYSCLLEYSFHNLFFFLFGAFVLVTYYLSSIFYDNFLN